MIQKTKDGRLVVGFSLSEGWVESEIEVVWSSFLKKNPADLTKAKINAIEKTLINEVLLSKVADTKFMEYLIRKAIKEELKKKRGYKWENK